MMSLRHRGKRLGPIGLLSALTVVAASCGGSNQPHAAAPQTGPVWTLGVITDLTGAGSSGGDAQRTGLNFWVDQANRAGGVAGHMLKLDFCDTQSTPTGGANCARQLSTVDSHVILLSASLPPTIGAVPQLSNVVGITILPVLYPKAGTSIFQVSPAESALVAPMISAAKAAHYRSIGVLYTSDASGTAQLSAVQAGAAPAGLRVESKTMANGTTDVTTQLLQLKDAGASVIFLATIGTNTTAALTSYHNLGLSMPIVLGAQAVSNSFLKALPFPIPKKMYGVSNLALGAPGLTATQRAAWSDYQKRFKSSAHEPIDSETAIAYYAACVGAGALKGTRGGSSAELATYLAQNPVTCLGSQMRFNAPGLNVVTNQPAALTQAGPTVGDGWTAVRNHL